MAVKSKKNFFDAIDFDEIGDSMDLWWNTIHDSYQFDAISKKKEFNAVVISPPVPIGANSNEMDTFMDGVSGNFTDTLPKFVFRARLKDVASHHVFWPDPCDPRFVEDAGGQENAIDWISKHMKVMAINATEVPKVGDTVRVKLNKQGIYTANAETAIMVGLVTSLDSIDPTALASLDSAECRGSLSKVFDGYTPPSESVYVPLSDRVASNGADFMKALRASGHFGDSDFTDAFLAGLAANAQAESNFNAAAAGDPVKAYEVGTKSRRKAQLFSIQGKCSWGLFQLNVCGGGGQRFANKHGFTYTLAKPLDNAQKQQLKMKLLDKGEYLQFISEEMKRIPALNTIRNDPSISAKQAGQFIATYFERCEGCKLTNDFYFPDGWSTSSKNANQTIARGKNALQILTTFKASPLTSAVYLAPDPPASPTPGSDPGSSEGFDPLATVFNVDPR